MCAFPTYVLYVAAVYKTLVLRYDQAKWFSLAGKQAGGSHVLQPAMVLSC